MKYCIHTVAIVFLQFFSTLLLAQQHHERCATDIIFQQNAAKHPGYAQAALATFNAAKLYAQAANKTDSIYDTVYHIPVVVHIVYHTAEENLPDSLVQSQLQVINRDYRRRNADTSKTRSYFKQFASDAGIEFYLATTDPSGNPTTGITRTQTSKSSFAINLFGGGNGLGIDAIKYDTSGGINAWPVDKYLNIWVGNINDSLGLLGEILGFSYPPATAPHWPAGSAPADSNMQGVCIYYKVFGYNNPLDTGALAIANQGRTVTHEVGHYLGLRHIWGDSVNFLTGTNGCAPDDGIDDTPKANNNAQNVCDTTKNTCNDSLLMGFDYPDMIENYMDYSDEHCQNMFTHGQVALMRAMLATARVSLAYTTSEVPTGISNPYEPNIEVRLYPNPANRQVGIVANNLVSNGLLNITNLLGIQVGETMALAQGGNNISINVQDFAKGIYLVRIIAGNSIITRKLVVE